ncbi:PDR/VanB family oxidoreductase [Streptomyces sp. NBC_01003]|uniref:PDR/VanB family oxidoreductase n=1 Tax=Streptomyces sp. NBC_01003 TaxID=2903714 RepID=UPI00386DD452|nr:PDR/VanB family oxidoreductase [Streptomyces sp. NBC_01003]
MNPPHEADLVVAARTEEADGVVSLTFRHPQGATLPPWEPGAHVDLVLTDGLVRSYSLCGDPADRAAWTVAVLHEPLGRGGSAYVHEKLTPGAVVRVRGPRNHFPLHEAPGYRFVAGGIGITPILPMVAAAEAAGAEWSLLYGGRTRGSMAFLDRLSAYGTKVRVAPEDETGLLDLDGYLGPAGDEALVYCCGPGPLLDAVEARGAAHTERFRPAQDGPDSTGGTDHAFEVELRRSGRTVTVPPGRSILHTVQDAGIDVLYSCAEGTCGTCETDIMEGAADHRDSVLTAGERAAGETLMICVSRCRGPRLVLDM